jgi:hypothetical protein
MQNLHRERIDVLRLGTENKEYIVFFFQFTLASLPSICSKPDRDVRVHSSLVWSTGIADP